MKKVFVLLCMMAIIVTASYLSASGQPSGLEKKGKVPPGFSQGEKTGWQNEFPPGWENKSEKEKKKWNNDVQKRRKSVLKAAKKKGMSGMEAESVADDFEKAARKGVEAKKAEALVKDKIKKGSKAEEISESVAGESEKIIKEKDEKRLNKKEKKAKKR